MVKPGFMNLKYRNTIYLLEKIFSVTNKDDKKASSLIAPSKMIEIENCGHWLPRDRSVEFIKALQNFI